MKIALVGTAPSSRRLAPFGDNEWQIWATGPANRGVVPRVDAWFEMHPLSIFENEPAMVEYLAWIALHPKLFLLQPSAEHPNSEVYPIDAMVAQFGTFYFSSTIAYMIAMAIEAKPEAIALYGIDMASDDEYAQQKTGCHRFIEIARERGIEVIIPPESDLMQTGGMYGYRQLSPMHQKLEARRAEVAARLATAKRAIEANTREVYTLEGALQDIDYMLRTWVG